MSRQTLQHACKLILMQINFSAKVNEKSQKGKFYIVENFELFSISLNAVFMKILLQININCFKIFTES